MGILNPQRAMLNSFTNSIIRTVKCEHLGFDALYGHFIYTGGVAAVRVGQKLGIPAFPGIGESTSGEDELWSIMPYGLTHAKREIRNATGVVVNSSLLANMIHQSLDFPSEKIGIFPNGTNLKLFCPADKDLSRKEFNFPEDMLIIACVGHFSDRKGQQRVMEAVEPLDGIKVGCSAREDTESVIGMRLFCASNTSGRFV